jgi:Domain of unknown function (DUF4389)
MEEQLNENLKQLNTWKRIFFMLLFAAIGGLVRMLLWAVILLQIASVLLTGKVNNNVLGFGRCLSIYIYHILLFLSFNTDVLPFPFTPWNVTADLKIPEPLR